MYLLFKSPPSVSVQKTHTVPLCCTTSEHLHLPSAFAPTAVAGRWYRLSQMKNGDPRRGFPRSQDRLGRTETCSSISWLQQNPRLAGPYFIMKMLELCNEAPGRAFQNNPSQGARKEHTVGNRFLDDNLTLVDILYDLCFFSLPFLYPSYSTRTHVHQGE